MKITEQISLDYCIFAEDIRHEKSNKFVLIGVIPGDILIKAIPGAMPVALFAGLKIKKAGDYNLWIRISGPQPDEAIIELKITTSDMDKSHAISLPRIDVAVEQEGLLKVDISGNKKKWFNMITKKVNLSEDIFSPLSPNASLPPA